MENGQLAGNLALNVLPVTDHEQIEANTAAVQSMEVRLIGNFIFPRVTQYSIWPNNTRLKLKLSSEI